MTATETGTRVYRLGEFHRFQAEGAHFLYLVPAGAIFAVDGAVGKIIDCLTPGELPHEKLVDGLSSSGLSIGDAEELIEEMVQANVVLGRDSVPEPPTSLPDVFPIQTLVMNLTNQCNLSCQYCYEFGADKVATPEGKPKFMDVETAKTVGGFSSDAVGRPAFDSHHLLRRRNADELPAVEAGGGVCQPASRGAGPSHRFQPDYQRHAADAGDHRVSFRESASASP